MHTASEQRIDVRILTSLNPDIYCVLIITVKSLENAQEETEFRLRVSREELGMIHDKIAYTHDLLTQYDLEVKSKVKEEDAVVEIE